MNPKKLPSGHWQITFSDAERRKRRETFNTQKEAKAALDERRTSVRNREYVAPAAIPTVREAALSWLEGKKVSESKHGGPVKASSIAFWQNHIDRFIVPTLGSCRLDTVTTALVEQKRGEWKALGNLSGKTVNKILTTLDAIFQKQLALRSIRFNPVSVAERMARGSNEVTGDHETDIDGLEVRPDDVYGPQEIARILEHAEEGFDKMILQVAAHTGQRHGELLGSKFSDVDFVNNTISVKRNWSGLYRDGEPIFTTPKTTRSIRCIRISNELSLALKKWKLQCPKNKYDLIFPTLDGKPQNRKAAWRALDKAVAKANKDAPGGKRLRRLTIHSLRHSFASISLMSGTPVPEVSAILGHANVNITLQVYAHFVPKMQTDSAERFAATIRNASTKGSE